MDLEQKIQLLGRAAQYDTEQGCGTQMTRVADDLGRWIYPAVRPDGRRVRMLKILQSNVCMNDCAYCAFRSGRDIRRTAFSPDELAKAFDQMYRRDLVEALFLSSGICGSVQQATDRMLATIELVRRRYGFPGYIHLKVLPGADQASIEQSVALADRVSVNLEAPSAKHLRALSAEKNYEKDLMGTMVRMQRARENVQKRTSMTTQFVVGPAGESDQELLSLSSRLYDHVGLARAYYSAFQPISDTPLADHAGTPLWREHRLYQADFLMRSYGFCYGELVFDAEGNLSRQLDPKAMWAQRHPEAFPVEVNRASRSALLRVPGIGPKSADTLVSRRRQGKLKELADLGMRPSDAQRAAPYLLLDGIRPEYQPSLWGNQLAIT